MVSSYPLCAQALGFLGWCGLRSAPACVLPGSTLHELQSSLSWPLLVLGLEIPRQSQPVNLGWLLVVPGWGHLARGGGTEGSLRLAVACLREFRTL